MMPNVIASVPLSFDVPPYESRWFRWAEIEKCFWPGRGRRAEQVNPSLAAVRNARGVYLMAWCSRAPKLVHPTAAKVKYVGHTNYFKGRMQQFATSAGFWGPRDSGHSAGWRWPEGEKHDTWVSFFIIGESLPDHLAGGLRCWMEAVALEQYRLVHGKLPEINAAEGIVEFKNA